LNAQTSDQSNAMPMRLNKAQMRPVLAIDLGASHTKLAWRPGWTESTDHPLLDADHFFKSPSICIEIDNERHIPSIAIQTGAALKWSYGTDAAKLTPHPGTIARVNWKTTLFAQKPKKKELDDAIMVAKGFFDWLYSKLCKRKDLVDFGNCAVVLCIPALAERSIGFNRIKEALEKTQWKTHAISETLEPRANLIGLASTEVCQENEHTIYQARNRVTYAEARGPGKEFCVDIGTMYGQNNPMITWAAGMRREDPPKDIGIIDIGAFTTDFAVGSLNLNGEVKVDEKAQKSVRLGVASLDIIVKDFVASKGLDTNLISHQDFRLAKELIYANQECMISDGSERTIVKPSQSQTWVKSFATKVLTEMATHTDGWNAFVLTGGGAEIISVREALTNALTEKGLRNLQDSFDEIDTRIATALGAASVEVQKWNVETESAFTSRPSANTPAPSGYNCTCGGLNPGCSKCGGEAWIEVPVDPVPTRAERSGTKHKRAPNVLPPQVKIEITPSSTQNRVSNRSQSGSVRQPTDVPQEIKPLSVEELLGVWKRSKKSALQEHSLDGWMGDLIFGKTICDPNARKRCLSDTSSPQGQAAWLRLLCLGCCLSARIDRTTLKRFWEEELPHVWRALIPPSGKREQSKSYTEKLDSFFDKTIHKQFKNRNASWEDAELWRRVFYDFRKMHEFIYQNDIAGSLLELVSEPSQDWNALAHFLKSGFLPDGKKAWRGVLGQSMTSPILFILRELRRLEIMENRFDASCFYMNTAARRVAYGLGWITLREFMITDFDGLVNLSQKCHRQMRKEVPELLPWFDLPLQIYKSKK